ncbi:alpha/beta fold hydrolase [Nocardioides sp. GY 10113]|uniref:alpha/beta fold hydrolase n=1 Tax=Nocardioides sp. GY 10113 TaxID=2569761 RepID=UPI0010A8AC29|nr:alpha/beta fold hydrolase [Nocardioides sp. GY 10113]TIC80470.1 alpha/beta fold hydrolase [Nocardioides sp. GY 10113]
MNSSEVVATHERSGRRFEAAGVGSFVLDEGTGPPVVCLHGVPASSFLYRKVVPELAARGLRGIAFDLPGLGLADRPADFDYSWSGLGRFAAAAVDALGLDRFHLVVHDIGGPVGFEVAAAMPERVASMTVLDTIVEVDTFTPPWSMRPFRVRGLGPAYLKGLTKPVFRMLMRVQGVAHPDALPAAEADAYVDLLRRGDGGAAFLRIMRGFELTRAKRDLYVGTLGEAPYPVQVVWGERDPALPPGRYGEEARRAAGVDGITLLPGKHFLQEDHAPQIADLVAAFVTGDAADG